MSLPPARLYCTEIPSCIFAALKFVLVDSFVCFFSYSFFTMEIMCELSKLASESNKIASLSFSFVANNFERQSWV